MDDPLWVLVPGAATLFLSSFVNSNAKKGVANPCHPVSFHSKVSSKNFVVSKV